MSGHLLACIAMAVTLAACDQSAGNMPPAQSTDVAVPAQPSLPPGTHEIDGRTVTVRLPYRSADNLLWVAGSDLEQAAPYMFQSLDVEPKAGPDGTDLAVFVYRADRPGHATLRFGLVPAGKTLIGPPATRVDTTGIPVYSVDATAP